MISLSNINGWQIHHHEKLIYQSNKGTPGLRLKFYQYPAYRQTVDINRYPEKCHLKVKGNNNYFIFQNKVKTKGVISLERIIIVHPISSYHDITEDWGKISNISDSLKKKYQQKLRYWPLYEKAISDVTGQDWFHTDDLATWAKSASVYIKEKIKHAEKQDERLGAEQAFVKGIGDCDEFIDLFITFARMRGIPCRRLTGFYISTRHGIKNEAHAWGEILSPLIGWIPIDIPLNNLGSHYVNYIILKIEEFSSDLPDYQIQIKHSSVVHYQWELPDPIITPIY